jgi:hypothetical protein
MRKQVSIHPCSFYFSPRCPILITLLSAFRFSLYVPSYRPSFPLLHLSHLWASSTNVTSHVSDWVSVSGLAPSYCIFYTTFSTLSDCVPGLVVLSDRLKIHFPARIEHDYILVSIFPSKGRTEILSRQHALVGIFERIQVPHWTYWK